MIVIYNSKLVGNRSVAMTVFPFILVKYSKSKLNSKFNDYFINKMFNHEKIHGKQQLEMIILGLIIIPIICWFYDFDYHFVGISFLLFFVVYLSNWFVNLFIFRDFSDAYRRILFEIEAYDNDQNLDYAKGRKIFSWLFKSKKKKG